MRLLILNEHLYLSSVCLGLDLIMDIKKDMLLKDIGLYAQNLFNNSRFIGQHN